VAARFVIEVDGESRDADGDARKTSWLEAHGYRVYRVAVKEIDETMDDVMDSIYDAFISSNPHPDAASGVRPPHRVGR